jgi:hypothetical protein
VQFAEWRGNRQKEDLAENDERHRLAEEAPRSSPVVVFVLNQPSLLVLADAASPFTHSRFCWSKLPKIAHLAALEFRL